MKLSLIMPVYNRERFVVPALRSLLRQRDAADLDIIVIDDGSTDGSAEAVRAMCCACSRAARPVSCWAASRSTADVTPTMRPRNMPAGSAIT